MNCKPGDVAQIVCTNGIGTSGETFHKAKNRFITVVAIEKSTRAGPCWTYEESPICADSGKTKATSWPDAWLRPIRDQPGNEDFVVKARNTLPRAKPVTGPVTINERGEAA
jgi:hypothetical protein